MTGQIALIGMHTPPKQMVPLMLLAARGWDWCSLSGASMASRCRVDGVRDGYALHSAAALLPSRLCLCGPATVRTKRCSYWSQEIRRCTELCQSAAVALFDRFQGTAAVELLLASVLHR